jgi:Pentapeptide repeats (8 copies)
MRKRSSDELQSIDAAIDAVLAAPTNNFLELVALAGLERDRDFRFANLEDVDFSGMDLQGFDFSGANFRNAKFHRSKIAEATFSADAARFAELKQALDWTELAIFSGRKSDQRSKTPLSVGRKETLKSSKEVPTHRKKSRPKKVDGSLPFDELTALASRLMDESALDDARAYYEAALLAAQRDFGDRSPKFVFALQRLANCTSKLGEVSDTRKLLRRAVDVAEELFDREPEKLAKVRNGLADFLMSTRDYGEAARTYSEIAQLRWDKAGEDALHAAGVLVEIARHYLNGGNHSDAGKLNRMAIDAMAYYLGRLDPSLRRPLEQLIQTLRAGRRSGEIGKFEKWLGELSQ